MGIKLNTIGQTEHAYAFENAVIESDMLNGTFGEVNDGVFTPCENGTKAIMNLENGDDANMLKYMIPKGSQVRVIDFAYLSKDFAKNEFVEFIGYPLPDEFAVGDKLASDAEGKLVVGAATAPYFEVEKVYSNNLGVKAKMVLA